MKSAPSTKSHADAARAAGEQARPARCPPPALRGAALSDIETPALFVDADALDANFRKMSEVLGPSGMTKLRPHAKAHKCIELAHRQMAEGAMGLCCQTVAEAEAFLLGGVRDIVVTNQVVSPGKLRRLARLARFARIEVCVDHLDNVHQLDAAAEEAETKIFVRVEVNVGGNRSGVEPGPDVAHLARAIKKSANLRYTGVQCYSGPSQHIFLYEERIAENERIATVVRRLVEQLTQQDLAPSVIAGAGTGTFDIDARSGLFDELQAGSYLFMDAKYARNLGPAGAPCPAFRQSLFVMATVTSAVDRSRVVIDAGVKACSMDAGPPSIAGRDDIVVTRTSDEHLMLKVGGEVPSIGTRLSLIPANCDPTVNLYDWYIVVRDNRVEDLWPIVAQTARHHVDLLA